MVRKQADKVDIVYVARLAGVSPATVSRTINHPELVNPATRKKVDSAIRKSGYIRNRAAQAMHGRRSATIGFVVPTLNYTIFAEVVQSFNDAVSAEGFTLLLCSHDYDLEVEYNVIRKLLEHRVDAVALIGFDHSADSLRLLQEQRVPLLSVWNYDPQSPFSCVGADNAEAGRRAAEHILLLGHERIGVVFPPVLGNDRARARRDAVMKTLSESGIEIPDDWILETPYSVSQSKQACARLLAADARPTALICGNDIIAYGAVYAAAQIGLTLPRDLSIIGIGDFTGSADMEPALTTVRIPARKIGSLAGRHIVEAISAQDETAILRERCDLDLMMRATTAPPRKD